MKNSLTPYLLTFLFGAIILQDIPIASLICKIIAGLISFWMFGSYLRNQLDL